MQQNDDFLRKLGTNLDAGITNYVYERRTPIFRMHAELVIIQEPEEPVTEEVFQTQWMPGIQQVMVDFFATHKDHQPLFNKVFDSLSAVICFCPLKHNIHSLSGETTGRTKTTVHIVWPWVFCDSMQAESIRSGWIQHFERDKGKRQAYNIWEDVFNAKIYRGNDGVRMVGSDEVERCPVCKGKTAKDGACPAGICNGRDGLYGTNRIFRLIDVVDRENQRAERLLRIATKSGAAELKLTSIRSTQNNCTPMVIPVWFDEHFFHDEAEVHQRIFKPTPTQRKRRRELIEQLAADQRGARRLGLHNCPKISHTAEQVKCLQRWFRDTTLPSPYRLPDVYRHTQILDLSCHAGPKRNYFIVRTDSMFCLNKASEHVRNSIYFLVRQSGMVQKCFCDSETIEGRKFGPCKTFESAPWSLPFYVRRELFSDNAKAMEVSRGLVRGVKWSELTDEERDMICRAKDSELERLYARRRHRREIQYAQRFDSKRT